MIETRDALAASATAAPVVPVRARRLASIAFAVALLGVEAVILAESYRGLVGFAHMIGIRGVAALGVPISLDGVAIAAAFVALRAELAGESSGVYRATMFAFTGASAAANFYHGIHTGGAPAALYLGGMSLAVAWVFSLSLRQIRHEARRDAGISAPRLPRFSLAHWSRYPRLTFRAFSLAVRDGHSTARAALDAAHAPAPAEQLAAAPASLPSAAATRRPRPASTAPRPTSTRPTTAGGRSLAADIRDGIAAVGESPREVVAWLEAERGRPNVAPSRVYDILRRDRATAAAAGDSPPPVQLAALEGGQARGRAS
jgi:hypothetical protein